jgi:hypothetical protein
MKAAAMPPTSAITAAIEELATANFPKELLRSEVSGKTFLHTFAIINPQTPRPRSEAMMQVVIEVMTLL